jgi:hypothetical protein
VMPGAAARVTVAAEAAAAAATSGLDGTNHRDCCLTTTHLWHLPCPQRVTADAFGPAAWTPASVEAANGLAVMDGGLAAAAAAGVPTAAVARQDSPETGHAAAHWQQPSAQTIAASDRSQSQRAKTETPEPAPAPRGLARPTQSLRVGLG